MWRILSGEQLKVGDAKLEQMFSMVEVLIKDLGNPLTVISSQHPRLFKLLNSLGILHTISYYNHMVSFTENVLTNHKKAQIDGNFCLIWLIFLL